MITGILISLCLFIPGLAWVGLCGQQPNAPKPSWQTSLVTLAGALAIGLLWNTLFTLFLLECGAFSPNVIIAGTLIFASLGAWLSTRRAGTAWRTSLRHALPVLSVFVILAVLIGTVSPHGEWLAGGWDPGVNINQGICASRQGAWQKPPTEAFADLARLPFNPFIRHIAGRDELFPGIPMSPETGALQLTFYPLTPAWIALLHTLGGMQAALQAMSYLALILAFILTGALLRINLPARIALPTTLLMLIHPLIGYHAHTPCSEMMETVCVAMIGLAMLNDTRVRPSSTTPLMAVMLLAGILNRPTFLIWCALLIMILAITRRLNIRNLMILAFPVLLGIIYYLTHGQSSLDRLSEWFPWLALATVAAIGLATLVIVLRQRYTLRLLEPLTFILAPLTILLLAILANPVGTDEIKLNLLKMAPYLGYPFILLGAGGFLIRLNTVVRTSRMTRLDMLLWIGLCAELIPLAFKFAAELYPWATKRFLSSLPLFLCLTTAVLLAAISDWMGTKWKKSAPVPVLLGLIIVFAVQANRIRDAWQHTEYDGLAKKLDKIAHAVDTDAILVTDHFLWATPLTLSFGLQAINGERLWAQQSEIRTDAAMRFFRSQHDAGRRVFILTSTEQGIAIFPPALQPAVLRVTFDPYAYHTIAHHRNGNGFPQRKHPAVFRLYEYVQTEAPFSQAKPRMKPL